MPLGVRWVRLMPRSLHACSVVDATGVRAEVAAANPATGEITVLGPAASIGAPAVAQVSDGLVAAWAADGGGAAVSVNR